MEEKGTYGWSTASTLKPDGTYTVDNNNVDTHMMKNVEWGAVAYLSKSVYGKNTIEVYPNNSQTFETGCAANSATQGSSTTCLNTYESTNGLQASTTGTIYGVYDMSGGAWERVAAFVNNGNVNLNGQGLSIINALGKYKDIYDKNTIDDNANNYILSINKKGDGIYETSSDTIASNLGWFSDYSIMPNVSVPWFVRGGYFSNGFIAGSFAFYHSSGSDVYHYDVGGFRPVLLVEKGL